MRPFYPSLKLKTMGLLLQVVEGEMHIDQAADIIVEAIEARERKLFDLMRHGATVSEHGDELVIEFSWDTFEEYRLSKEYLK